MSKPKFFKKWCKNYNNNIIRRIIKFFSPYIRPIIGSFYFFIHWFFMVFSVLCLCLSNNIVHLFVLLFIMYLDMIFILSVHQCPLTILEKKYLGTSINQIMKQQLKRMGINYKCNHLYESQLECVITMCSIITSKIFILIFIDAFKLYI
jgi:hypothetical protein